MAFLALSMVVLLAMTGYSRAAYCVCNGALSDPVLQKNIDYACGAGADCGQILQNGPCFNPNTVKDHCNFAVNSYFQKKGQVPGSCDFSGTAITSPTAPPGANSACYSGTSTPTPGTGTGTGTPTIGTPAPPTGTGTPTIGTPTPPTGTGTPTIGTPTPPTGTGTGTPTIGTPTPGTGTGTGIGNPGTGTGTGTGTGIGTGPGTGGGINVNPPIGLGPAGINDNSGSVSSHYNPAFLTFLTLLGSGLIWLRRLI